MTATATKPKPSNKPAVVAWDKPTNKAGLESLITPVIVQRFNKGLPGVVAGQAERMIQSMIMEAQTNPSLMDCTPVSLFSATLRAALLGLTIGGPMGEAYLVPFNNRNKGVKEAQLIPGYKGYIKLAHRSDRIMSITPVVVREGDTFEITRGLNQDITHKPLRGGEHTRKATDFYVVVKMVNGGLDFETFTVDDALEHRNRYAMSKPGPWYDMRIGGDFEKQALKTMICRLAKRLPLSADLSDAAKLEEDVERDVGQPLAFEPDPMPALSPDDLQADIDAAELRERAEAAAKEPVSTGGKLPGMEGGGNLPD